MQIVIDIPEEKYQGIVNMAEEILDASTFCSPRYLYKAVLNGTPLPKGHGRLIDADEAIKTLESLGNRDYRRAKGTIQEAVKMLRYDDYTPTVIEAESEG